MVSSTEFHVDRLREVTCGTPVLVVLNAHQEHMAIRDLRLKYYDVSRVVHPDRNGSVEE